MSKTIEKDNKTLNEVILLLFLSFRLVSVILLFLRKCKEIQKTKFGNFVSTAFMQMGWTILPLIFIFIHS